MAAAGFRSTRMDHVDAADGGARGRPAQAGHGDMLARNVEQPAGILEKEVMMVTDVGVEIGVRAGKGILCTIAAVRHQRNQVVATLLKRDVLLRKALVQRGTFQS